MRHFTSVALGVTTALLATTALVVAQPASPPPAAEPPPASAPAPAAPVQTTENPLVAATTATHIAVLGAAEAAAAGAAWLHLDPQNNTLMWTIELTGFTATAIGIACGEGEMGPEAAGVAFDLAAENFESPIEGQAGTVDQALFDGIEAGQCWVIATGAGEGNEIRGVIETVEPGGM